MISFLEMVQRYPIGAKVDLPRTEGRGGPQEIVGYEYYNGTGYLVFGDEEKVNAEQLSGQPRQDTFSHRTEGTTAR